MTPEFDLENPARRGRRDPDARRRMEAEAHLMDVGNDEQDLSDYGDTQQQISFVGLMPGDTVMAKTAIQTQSVEGEMWSTYGVITKIDDGETEQQAASRALDVVNTRVIELAEDAHERLAERAEQLREEQRSRRLTGTGRTRDDADNYR